MRLHEILVLSFANVRSQRGDRFRQTPSDTEPYVLGYESEALDVTNSTPTSQPLPAPSTEAYQRGLGRWQRISRSSVSYRLLLWLFTAARRPV